MKRLPPVVIIILSFLATILVGSVLFMLPISLQPGKSISWFDSLFLSTSAITTTGLTTFSSVSSTLSIFGKLVLGILIQIGGLGFVTIATFFFFLLGGKIGINDRYLLKEALNQDKVSDVLKLLKSIILITVTIELLGAFASFFVFVQDYDVLSSIGISLFHSVSAFNDAGFDIIGSTSLQVYRSNIALNIITITVSLLGGLGFIVIKDLIASKFNLRKLKIHSKIVLSMTFSILLIATITTKVSMWNSISWMDAFFHASAASSAGFSTLNVGQFASAAVLLLSVVMVIGGSPTSTGGGIKTTTIFVLIKSMTSFAAGKPTIVMNRKISEESKLKAFSLFFFVISFILMCVISIYLLETSKANIPFESVIFECCSAFSTAGLSMGITSSLSLPSQFILCVLMFVGRIGPITIMGMWNLNWNKPGVNNVDYLEQKIIIG